MPFDLEAEIARRLNVSREAVAPVLDAVIERIRKQVSHFGYARLAGLGTFRGQNGRLSFEPEAALSDQVNVRFAGLEEITVEAPPLLDREDDAGPEVPFEDTDRLHAAPDASDFRDSSTEAGAGGVFDTEEKSGRPEEEISDDQEGEPLEEKIPGQEGEPLEEKIPDQEGEPLEIDEEREDDDAEYGESPGDDYERGESGSKEALAPDDEEELTEPGQPEDSWRDELHAEEAADAETTGIFWDASRGSGTEIDEEGEHPESADDVEDADLEGWADAEDEPETWLEHSDEEHPLGTVPEQPFEEADYSVLDERQDAASKSDASGDADAEVDAGDVESDRDLSDSDFDDADVAADAETDPEGDIEDEFRYVGPAESEADLAEDDGDYLAGEDDFPADEDDFLADEDDFLADEDEFLADEDEFPADEDDYLVDEDDFLADEDDYLVDEDDYLESEEGHLDDDLVEADERTPSVEWNVTDEPAVSGTYEGDTEYGDESEEEDAGMYAASAAAASGEQGASEEDASQDDDAPAYAAAGGAAQHERLRQPSERRHAAAQAAGGGAAGGNRSAIWIGVGVLVLVAAAAVVYFSMTPTPSVTPEGPPVTEERDAPAPADTSAAASAAASAADESPADTTVAATPATPDVQDDPDPLRSPEGLDLSTGGYTLIVYSETSESGASNVMAQFRENGFRTSVLEDSEGATTRYRVGVGQFATLDEAVEARDRLAGNELPDDAWVRRIQ